MFPALTGFAWADFDADGDPDAAFIDEVRLLHIFSNERQGQFSKRNLPFPFDTGPARAINVADLNSDGVLDLAIARADGAVMRLSDKDHGVSWDVAEVAKIENITNDPLRLRIADVDNNGGLDLLLGSTIALSDENGKFT